MFKNKNLKMKFIKILGIVLLGSCTTTTLWERCNNDSDCKNIYPHAKHAKCLTNLIGHKDGKCVIHKHGSSCVSDSGCLDKNYPTCCLLPKEIYNGGLCFRKNACTGLTLNKAKRRIR